MILYIFSINVHRISKVKQHIVEYKFLDILPINTVSCCLITAVSITVVFCHMWLWATQREKSWGENFFLFQLGLKPLQPLKLFVCHVWQIQSNVGHEYIVCIFQFPPCSFENISRNPRNWWGCGCIHTLRATAFRNGSGFSFASL